MESFPPSTSSISMLVRVLEVVKRNADGSVGTGVAAHLDFLNCHISQSGIMMKIRIKNWAALL